MTLYSSFRVAIAFTARRVGDVSVIRCTGRIVMGAESAALGDLVEERLARTRSIVLQLAQIDSIDSSGLGLLVRLQRRVETAHGRLALCLPSARVVYALQTARMHTLFEVYDAEAVAIEALHRPMPSAGDAAGFVYANVLCALDEPDLLSYVSELLTQVGYAVLAADNRADAETLLRVLAEPKLVITTPAFRGGASAPFMQLLAAACVLDLPPAFSTANVDASAQALLGAVSREFGAPSR